MSIHLTEVFAKKPDLILRLVGEGILLTRDLIGDGFTLRGTPDNATKSEVSKLATESALKHQKFEVDMHVSSKHLTEASSYFDTLLDGNFSEALSSKPDKLRQVVLKEIHVMAFALLMDILHLRTTNLMHRKMEFSLFFYICVLVDMYGMHGPTLFYTNLWFEVVRTQVEPVTISSVEDWICITYILRKEQSFREATACAQRGMIELQNSWDGPIPVSVRDELREGRLTALSRCADSLAKIIHEYEDEHKILCPRKSINCDALVLGSLIRKLKKADLYPLDLPNLGRNSVDAVRKKLSELNVVDLCNVDRRLSRGSEVKDCGLKSRIKSITDCLQAQTAGLTLPQY